MPAVPTAHLFDAAADWQAIDLISDLHLAADTPKGFEAWASFMRTTSADAVFMLGDWLELWVGDDARDGEFEQRCIEVLREATRHRVVAFMAGNRDFLIGDEMLQACGMQRLPDPTLLNAFGQRYLLTHGDALCLGDVDYQRFRSQVRDARFIQSFLARPIEERRAVARSVRDGSQQRKAIEATGVWADVDLPEAAQWLEAAQSLTMIHGHTHRPATQKINATQTRHVLSDWDFDQATPGRGDVLRISAAGVSRLAPIDAAT